MKLYTKEMFLIAAERCEVSMIDAKHIIKYIDEYVTPIELPSDEEIEKESYIKLPILTYSFMEGHDDLNRHLRDSWVEGIEWYKKQLKKQI